MLRGNQHGAREYDDLQNWLYMTSHFKDRSDIVTRLSHPGHARDFAWYRGQRPSPAHVIKMSHNNNSRTRKCGGFVA